MWNINLNLVIQWFPAILTILSRISVKLLATMGTSVIKEMWNQARKSYYNANANERFPKICQQHNYGTANHQRVSHFSGLFYCHFTHSAASIAFDLPLFFHTYDTTKFITSLPRLWNMREKSEPLSTRTSSLDHRSIRFFQLLSHAVSLLSPPKQKHLRCADAHRGCFVYFWIG